MTKPTVATPIQAYKDMAPTWVKCRAVCGGEDEVKEHDQMVQDPDNFLIPFSVTMDQRQYDFLKREAELPGVSAEFAHLLVGALLRREPIVKLPDSAPEGAVQWLTAEIGSDGSPLVAYMDSLLWEEVVTTRGWTFVDNEDNIPYPTLYPAESVINWTNEGDTLTRIITSEYEEVAGENEFHPDVKEFIYVHELKDGLYQVRKFQQSEKDKTEWTQVGDTDEPMMADKRMTFIPAWPNTGDIDPPKPFLLNIINKEIALYNKLTRRNHLLYNASTFTPYICSDMEDSDFQKVVDSGLGSWLNLPESAKIGVLSSPTDSLDDLEKSIANGFEEMARLGIRMMSPETAQSGVALQLRNASQTAKIGTLNTKVSVMMCQILAVMVNWRYGTAYKPEDIKFDLQSDFMTYLNGEGWLRLATEWYENRLIPRSIWVQMLRQNEILPDDYDDEKAQAEISAETDDFESYVDTLEEEALNV